MLLFWNFWTVRPYYFWLASINLKKDHNDEDNVYLSKPHRNQAVYALEASSLLVNCHSIGRFMKATIREKYSRIKSIITCAIVTIMGVTNYYMIGCKTYSTIWNTYLILLLGQEHTAMLLNGYMINLNN